jgi:hypothetical protein
MSFYFVTMNYITADVEQVKTEISMSFNVLKTKVKIIFDPVLPNFRKNIAVWKERLANNSLNHHTVPFFLFRYVGVMSRFFLAFVGNAGALPEAARHQLPSTGSQRKWAEFDIVIGS